MTKFFDIQKNYPDLAPSTFPEAADLIVHYIEQTGSRFVFGVPGGAIEPLYNALARSERRGGVASVVARHESGAAFMADGYARETGLLGVCCTTTGPGATNIITGVASAYQDDIPLLVITAQTPLDTFGRGAVQESSCTGIDTVAMMGHCTHYNSLVSDVRQLERKLVSAITTAFQARGPAHLSIPLDILRTPTSFTGGVAGLASLMQTRKLADPAEISALARRVRKAHHPILIVGEGCTAAMGPILKLAERIGALLVTTPQGKGLVDPYHPNYRGVCGLAGHEGARRLLRNPAIDLVLIIGSALDEQAAQGWLENENLRGKIAHIDELPRHFTRSLEAEWHILGSIEAVFTSLLTQFGDGAAPAAWDTRDLGTPYSPNVIDFERRLANRRRNNDASNNGIERRGTDRRHDTGLSPPRRHFGLTDEAKYLGSTTPIRPQRLMYDLARLLPADTCYLADIGNSFLWGIHYLHPHLPLTGREGRTDSYFRTCMGFASMGWAIGAAVGTALGNPERPVVCLVGDGSYLMSGQEITTAIQHELCIIFIILNDSALGTVKHGQRLAKAERIGYELPPVDYAALANALGVEAYRVRSPEDLQTLDIRRLCRRRAPVLIDVYVDGEETPPLAERMNMLAMHW
ncbi:MAG: thiamine pyrophosphate-binding protein [Gammaproteobacteria bacterium]|nr:thiamine pyrophosphate-binding protein [Gammaproteobacteria bacterium]